MSVDPRELMHRLFQEVDLGRDDFVDEYYAADYRDHTPSRTRGRLEGREGVRQAFALFRRAFPDARHRLDDVIVEGDRVVVRLSAWGTHTGEIFGVPPTGREVSQTGIAIYRLANGKIAERWSVQSSELLDELGVTAGAERAPGVPREA